jgi:hypothetical protein
MKQLKSLFVAIVILVSMTGKTPAFASGTANNHTYIFDRHNCPNTSITI